MKICPVCGKQLHLKCYLGHQWEWECPDEKCGYNEQQIYTASSNSGDK